MSYSQNTPTGQGRNNPADAVVPQDVALWGGVAATVLVGLPLAIFGIFQVLDLIGELVWFALGAYSVGAIVQYWTAQSWRDGLTGGELFKAAVWPWDMLQTIRAGVSNQPQTNANAPGSNNPNDALVSEQVALWGGVLLTLLVGLPLAIFGIFSILGIIGSLVWLAVAVYLVGLIVQYWVSKAYLDGLTTGEVIATLVWPVATFQSIRAGVKARLNRS
jgi:hypothetical protein